MYPAALPRRRTAPSRTPRLTTAAGLWTAGGGRMRHGRHRPRRGRGPAAEPPRLRAGGGLGHGPPGPLPHRRHGGREPLRLAPRGRGGRPLHPETARWSWARWSPRPSRSTSRAKKRIQLIRALWQLAETCGEEAVEKALEALKSAVEEAKS